MYKCKKCKKELDGSEAYEYRGAYSCEEHFDEVCEKRDWERQELIKEEDPKLKPLKGLDLSPETIIGKANRELLKSKIEIASKESFKMKEYEGRNKK